MVAGVTATSNSTANTQDLFLEIGGTTVATLKVKRVRVGFGSGTQSAGIDNSFLIQFYRYDTSTAGAPSSLTYSPDGAGSSTSTSGLSAGSFWTSRNPNYGTTVPAGLTCKVKNGSTALVIGTTDVQIVDQIAPNGRALYEWLARDDDDMILTIPAAYFAVALTSNIVSQVFTVTVDFIM